MKMSAKIWEQHVATARQQKVSTKTYANQHGLSPSTLYYWQRKMQATANLASVAHAVSPSNQTGKFVSLRVADACPDSAQQPSHCALILGSSIRLEMSALPDPRWLVALARTAQGAF